MMMKKLTLLLMTLLNVCTSALAVEFTRVVKMSDLVVLNTTKIKFPDGAVEICSQTDGVDGDIQYFGISTPYNNFLLRGDLLYINGRQVFGFKAGKEYSCIRGKLYKGNGKPLSISKSIALKLGDPDATLGRDSMKNGDLEIQINNFLYAGGSYKSFDVGYGIYNCSYVCIKLWNSRFILWGVDYGKVNKSVIVDVKNLTIQIDGGKPTKIILN